METDWSILDPISPADAVGAIRHAIDREQIFELLLRALKPSVPFVALLSVHANELRVRHVVGDAAAATDFSMLKVPRMAVPAFEDAIATRTPAIAAIRSDEPFVDGLLEPLRGNRPEGFVMPIGIRNRTVALIVGRAGGRGLADFADLLPLADATGFALARVIAARTKLSGPAVLDPDYEIELTVSELGIDSYLNVIGAGFLLGIIGWGFLGIQGFVFGAALGVAGAVLRSRIAHQPQRQSRRRRHRITERVR